MTLIRLWLGVRTRARSKGGDALTCFRISGKYANPVSYSQTVVKLPYNMHALCCEATIITARNILAHVLVDGGETRSLTTGDSSSRVAISPFN
jgi:hypothetical protein